MNNEGATRVEWATTSVLRDCKNSLKVLQLKKKDNYVVIKQKYKGGGREGVPYERWRNHKRIHKTDMLIRGAEYFIDSDEGDSDDNNVSCDEDNDNDNNDTCDEDNDDEDNDYKKLD